MFDEADVVGARVALPEVVTVKDAAVTPVLVVERLQRLDAPFAQSELAPEMAG